MRALTPIFLALILLSPELVQAAALENPLQGTAGAITTIPQAIGVFIRFIIGFVGSGAMVMFVWGGLKYILAGGDEKAIAGAKNIMTWAVYGLIIIFFAFAITSAITGGLETAGAPNTATP